MRPVFALLLVVLLVSGCGKKKKTRAPQPATPPAATQKAPAEDYVPNIAAVSPRYHEVTQARFEETQVVMLAANGSRSIAPISGLSPADLAWLKKIARENPLARGKSSIVVVASTELAKKTIQVSKIEGTLETVQLCPPNVIRDQIGATCMIYARVHWLDIAGYYLNPADIYKIINDTPHDRPWLSPRYVAGLNGIMENFRSRPLVHNLPGHEEPFEWARAQLRKGRPLLAALPREIWQALPSGFIAAHPWNGGSIGHQIVINGFTWDSATQKGTFHVVNSWAELMEFDVGTDDVKNGLLVFEKSMSPIGEAKEEVVKETVKKITFIKPLGDSSNLYEVETNLTTRRVAAPSEDRIYSLIEESR